MPVPNNPVPNNIVDKVDKVDNVDKAETKATTPATPRIEQAALAKYTTLGVGGLAEIWHIESLEDLQAATSQPYRIMGAGSNLLIGDAGVEERVIRLGKAYNTIKDFDGSEEVWLGAATPVPGLVRRATEYGLTGLEGMLGIPAVLGGAIAMNAGTRYGEIGDVLTAVELFVDGELQIVDPESLNLRYRHSELPEGAIVTRARVRLEPASQASIEERIEAVDSARKGQPKVKSAGCAFKNPEGDSAGRLIDVAGLKGLQVGGAMVSIEHGNFIVNLGDATADDVIQLLKTIRRHIASQMAVPLEVEWECWGFEDFKQASQDVIYNELSQHNQLKGDL